MLDFSIYLLYRLAAIVIAILPLRFAFSLGNLLGTGAWLFAVRYRNLAIRNVTIAFGNEKPVSDLRRIVRRHFQNLGANLLSGIKINSMSLAQVASLSESEGHDQVETELRAGRPVVLALSHIGNWELFTRIAPHRFGYAPLGTIYQRLGNQYLDRHVADQRARFGVHQFDRSEGFQQPIKLLRSGAFLGVLSDQHAGDHGIWTPFFRRLASTSPLAGLLSKRTGAAVFAAAAYTNGPGRWRIVFSRRLDAPEDTAQSITAKINTVLEEQIRHAPQDWFWVHNRWKTPQPKFLLSTYRRGIHLPDASDVAPLKPFRILIRGSNWLGDSIISMPAVRAIKAGRPDAHVTIAAPEKIAPVWRLLGEVDEVIALPNKSLWSAVRLLNSKPFDVSILFPNSLRSALEVWLARVPRRVGYAGHNRRSLLNQIIREPAHIGPPQHQAYRYLHIAETVGAKTSNGEIFPGTATPNIRKQDLARPKRFALCPGAEYGPAKRWLPERFAEVAVAVTAKSNVQWAIFGTVADVEAAEIIATILGDRCINRVGKTTIAELIDELRECNGLLTNDTGTMHLAALLEVPLVAVFGSTEPRLTGPLGSNSRVIRHQVECSPCFLRECPIDFRCMHAVSVDEVTAAVLSMSDGAAIR